VCCQPVTTTTHDKNHDDNDKCNDNCNDNSDDYSNTNSNYWTRAIRGATYSDNKYTSVECQTTGYGLLQSDSDEIYQKLIGAS